MNTKIKIGLGFVSGLAVGGTAVYLYLKDKMDKEITEARDFYLSEVRDHKHEDSEHEDSDIPKEESEDLHEDEIIMGTDENGEAYYAPKPTLETYERVLNMAKYKAKEEEKEEMANKKSKPTDYIYPIAEEDFDTIGFEVESLDYYSDDVLIDEDGDIVDDPVSKIGSAITTLENGVEDIVYVRDDYSEIDYEIIRDPRPYHDEEEDLD